MQKDMKSILDIYLVQVHTNVLKFGHLSAKFVEFSCSLKVVIIHYQNIKSCSANFMLFK